MPALNFERRVPFPPDKMLALVADLEAYPRFVPNCTEMTVRPDRDRPGNARLARMAIKFGPINQAYTSRVEVNEDAGTISATAIDGPFSHLDSVWHFTPEGEGTLITFDIDFGFSNPLVAAVADPAFAAKQREIIDAFITEAERRYG